MNSLVKIDYQILQLKKLVSTPGNPQSMTKKVLDGLVQSMKDKGWILDSPVVWFRPDGEYQIISGHHRVEAAMQAGIIETGCKVVEGITEEQARKFVLEANQRRGEFDDSALNEFIDSIVDDFDIDKEILFDDVGINDEIYESIIENKEDPEVEFTQELLEEHNYVVLYFDNSVDWQQALTLFDIKQVKALDSKDKYKKIGVGRVLNGAKALNGLVNI